LDLLKSLLLTTLLFTTLGCAKFSYVLEQGVGQLGLFSASRPHSVFLEDENVDPEKRRKIAQIQELKKYFSEYWQKEATRIYDRVTILDRDEVTTLVIASPFNTIKPHQECFWVVGCFPYLGFYKRQSAEKYAHKLEKKGHVTHLRPVYAYSTLGYLHDPVLSSFFHFDDFDLTQLIFHEMYHTIFFVKNEVDLNENLANYFSEQMSFEYFQFDQGEREVYQKRSEKFQLLRQKMVEFTTLLNEEYALDPDLERGAAQILLENFKTNKLRPYFKDYCEQYKITYRQCFPLNRDWNNASLAAFLTYEKRADEIRLLREKLGLSLTALQLYIEDKYQQYQKSRAKQSFEDYLFATNESLD
jgi:predicted aminopeptidase